MRDRKTPGPVPRRGMTPLVAVSVATLGQLAVSGVVVGCVYALAALGFNAVYNATGIINFAQGELVLWGGFLFYAGSQSLHLPLILSALLALAAIALIGALIQLGVVRQGRGSGHIGRGASLIGVALLSTAITAAVWGVDPLPVPEFTPGTPFSVDGVVVTQQQIWIVAMTFCVVFFLQVFFRRTTAGIAMRAASSNPDAARGVGVSVQQMALMAFVLAAVLGGIGGILITPLTGVAFSGGFALTLKGFTAAILGGLGNIVGAVVGGVALGLIESLSAAFISSGYQPAVPMAVLILVFLLRPGGILGVAVSRV